MRGARALPYIRNKPTKVRAPFRRAKFNAFLVVQIIPLLNEGVLVNFTPRFRTGAVSVPVAPHPLKMHGAQASACHLAVAAFNSARLAFTLARVLQRAFALKARIASTAKALRGDGFILVAVGA
jgi:hypothetical protein